ncbi:hypothetical protein DY000_02039166 [Brassica cretica]|uniref:Uncharacterized protein n=1 Tax=Brassica cretica TaxID=69181 RepID=A0ABQ7BJL4_BRACR|nr:hypothetical protein DY000_02039166 [Brassica cretica]
MLGSNHTSRISREPIADFKSVWNQVETVTGYSVLKKKGRLVGLGRRTRSVPPSSAPPPFVDPEMAAQQAGYEAQRRLNQQMMEMMQRMYPNEVFPEVSDP